MPEEEKPIRDFGQRPEEEDINNFESFDHTSDDCDADDEDDSQSQREEEESDELEEEEEEEEE